ncbi:MAG TPA: hypothetical protein VGC72_11690 [Candidatus Elarobacter sp.]
MQRYFITFAVLASAGGCAGGGGSPSASFVAPPAATASPSPPPSGALSVSRNTLAFTAAGQSATVDVSEPGYSGTIGFDGASCAAVANVAPGSLQNAPATFTITAQGAGACTLAFVDRFGQRASVAVGVTLTQGALK